MKKRIISIVLAALMIVSFLPTMAFAKSDNCSHMQKVTNITDGETYQMNLSGKNKGNFTFEASGKNWNIKNSDGKYLNAANGKMVLGNVAETAWTYSKDAFSISEKATQQSEGYWFLFWFIPGRGTKTVTTTYYLSTVTSSKLSTGYVRAELYKSVTGDHDYGKAVYVDKTNHKYVCKNCSDVKIETHRYNANTHKCVCGAYDPAESSVKISVDVKEKTTKKYIGWWPWGYYKTVTTYTATIKTVAKGVKVTKVQYQLNGGRWTTGTCVSSEKPIESLKVKAWDSNCNIHEYEWPEAPVPVFYNVTAQVQGDHGTATVKVGDEEAATASQALEGTNLVFEATPNDGYEFDYWEVVSGGIDIESSKTNNPISLTMPSTALTLKAHFKAIVPSAYGIIVEDDGHGTAKAQVDDVDVTSAAPSTTVTLVATANDGYAFKSWQIDRGLDSITGNSFTMPSNEVKVKAVFEKEYAVEAEAGGHGTVSADVVKGVSGKEVNLTITPDEGYEVDQITVVRGGVTVTGNKFNIGTADVKIRVTFKAIIPDTYGIIVEGDGHGTAKAQVGGEDVSSAAPNATVTLVPTANDGYAFKEWEIARGLEAGDITDNSFTMPSNEVKVKAIFERVYNITLQTNEHGTASATVGGETATTAAANAEVTLTATPAEGYQFKEWKTVSGGVTVTVDKFTMPTNNVTVQAVFEAVPETKNLFEILPSGFPTSADSAWVNENGLKAYKDGDNIKVGNLTLGKDTTVTKSGDDYVCTSGDATVMFKVKDGAEESITVTGSTDSNGTYTAPAAPTEYTVTFNLNGITGTAPETQKVAKDGNVTKPTDPTDSVHTFAGWYKTKDATTGSLSDPWDFDNGTVTADMTLYAQWTRTLESIYTNSDIPKVTGNTAPDNAWENGDGGKAFIAYSTGNTILTLYKKLEPSGAKQMSCRKTELFTKIGDDYVFSYGTERGVFTLHMTDSKFTSVTYDGAGTDYEVLSGTYTAPAAPTEYTVTFDLNGITGTAPTAQKIKDGEKVTKPADPTDTVHTFAGWYKTKDATTGALSDPWNFDNGTVTADMTLYAQWTRTMKNLLGNDFPKSTGQTISPPENAWTNANGYKAYIYNSDKIFKLDPGNSNGLACLTSNEFTRISDDKYVFKYVNGSTSYGVFTLNIEDSTLVSIEYNGAGTSYAVLSGTYTAPAAPLMSAPLMSMPAVEDVLLEDTQEMETVSELSEIAEAEQAEEIETIDETVEVVTTSLESIAGITDLNNIHWLGDAEGKECYISGSKLVFSNSSDTDEIGLNTLLLQNGNDWKLEKDSVIVTFVMKNGKLDRIVYEGDGRFNAVYSAPAEQEDAEEDEPKTEETAEEIEEESEPITEEPVEEVVEEAIEETTEETVTEESIVETESDVEESAPDEEYTPKSEPEKSEQKPKEQMRPVEVEEIPVQTTTAEETKPSVEE